MRPPVPPVSLVCPACRVPGTNGRLAVRYLDSAGVCSGCGTGYPAVDGVRCVPPDLATFRVAQARSLAEPWPPSVAECAAFEPGSQEFREAFLLGMYGLTHYPESPDAGRLRGELADNVTTVQALAGWLDQHPLPVDPPVPCALEVGCGPGRLLHALAGRVPGGAVGLDLRLSLLRVAARLADSGELVLPFRAEGRCFEPVGLVAPGTPQAPIQLVQGDIVAPPFDACAFPLVAALSLLDTVPDPVVALGQLDALVAPGGLLLLGAPYQWEPHVTPPALWWSDGGSTGPEALRRALSGGLPELPYLAYEVVAEATDLPWSLVSFRRLVHRYSLDVVLARKA